ncbi:fibronectin type III domain-containing protein [Hespellia stercorisuis]|uniref:Fibronectin type III domain-containing protein n=1 Tax=Hespellia stercorisuis DSM 15480 TaxID=1121950 RepID=A0A1M6R5E2_9FIRM|nr:CHAP domain-containing protein [Hespellia stercorisuis]SHK27672.1 Fibronectin type III domain-containing protein [Hespellia stercorisuis DSM 15480]
MSKMKKSNRKESRKLKLWRKQLTALVLAAAVIGTSVEMPVMVARAAEETMTTNEAGEVVSEEKNNGEQENTAVQEETAAEEAASAAEMNPENENSDESTTTGSAEESKTEENTQTEDGNQAEGSNQTEDGNQAEDGNQTEAAEDRFAEAVLMDQNTVYDVTGSAYFKITAEKSETCIFSTTDSEGKEIKIKFHIYDEEKKLIEHPEKADSEKEDSEEEKEYIFEEGKTYYVETLPEEETIAYQIKFTAIKDTAEETEAENDKAANNSGQEQKKKSLTGDDTGNIEACTTYRSQADALNWVRSKVGQGIDADGVYGVQCVDLILAYYDYLGVPRSSGNGKDYATNSLPAGWSRIYKAQPQPGDILVYGASGSNPYGHVAIYEADRITYHQNFGGNNNPVQRVTYRYDGLSNPYWGVIRPNFSNGEVSVSFTDVKTTMVDTWNAELYGKIQNPSRANVSQVGFLVWNGSGTLVASHIENCGLTASVITQTQNIVADSLPSGLVSGTYHTFQLYAVINGKNFYSDKVGFTTGGTAPSPDPTSVSVKKVTLNSAKRAAYNAINLSWGRNSSASGYVVYCSTSKNGSYKYVKTTKSNYNTKLKVTGLVTGKTYYFKVRAYKTVNGKKYYSSYSNIRSAKPSLGATKIIKCSNSSSRRVSLKWNKSTGASGYVVYRATSANGTYKRVKTTKGNGSVSYTNKGLTKGKTYYYKVRAYRTVSGKAVYSEWSGVKKVRCSR